MKKLSTNDAERRSRFTVLRGCERPYVRCALCSREILPALARDRRRLSESYRHQKIRDAQIMDTESIRQTKSGDDLRYVRRAICGRCVRTIVEIHGVIADAHGTR